MEKNVNELVVRPFNDIVKNMKILLLCISLFFVFLSVSALSLERAGSYINALDVTSAQVAAQPEKFSNTNHHTNALVVKLILITENNKQSDKDDALKIANHIIDNNMADMSFGGLFGAPLLTGGLGKGLPKETVESLSQLLYSILPDDPMEKWCDISYTNIYLMKTANLITLGEALVSYGPKAQKAAEAGYYFWQRWVEYTGAAGLHEFDSPTYTGVQLNGLYIISLYAKCEKHRSSATQVIDFLWSGIAASWFPAGQLLSGPHSRDYDFLFGKGLLTSQLFLAGVSAVENQGLYTCEYKDVHCEAMVCPWDVQMPESAVLNCIGSGLQAVFVYLAMTDNQVFQYQLPKQVLDLAHGRSKFVQKRWQEGPAGDYSLFVSQNFALGLISDDYNTNVHPDFTPYPPNAQDKVFSLALASRTTVSQSNPLSVMSFEPDWRRNGVYGKEVWEPQGKPFHLRLRPTAAMSADIDLGSFSDNSTPEGSAAVSVLLLAIDPLLNETSQAPPPDGTATHLALNTILPWMDGFKMRINGGPPYKDIPSPMSTASNFTLDVFSIPTISILGNNATTVVRVFLADSCGDTEYSYSRIMGDAGDAGGLDYHALRLETVLFDSADDSQDVRTTCASSGLLRVGLIIAAADAPNGVDSMLALEKMVNHAQHQVAVDGSVTSVDVTVGSTRFELARDMSGDSESFDGAIKYRRVNGVDVQPLPDGAKGAAVYVNGQAVAQFPKH